MTKLSVAKSNIIENLLNGKKIFAFSVVIILASSYIYQINSLAVLGYEFKKLEKEHMSIQKEVAQLKISSEKMKSAVNLQDRTKELSMVQSQKINYLIVSDSELAFSGASNY